MKPITILFLVGFAAFLVHQFYGGPRAYRQLGNNTGTVPVDVFGFRGEPERTARRGYR